MNDFAWLPASQFESIGLVGLAALLAGLIGLEREHSDKPAGFRTHMLVGGASAMLIILGRVLALHFDDIGALEQSLRIDPVRIMQAIIVGVSFIGAGTILKVEAEDRVRYLTTAASILLSAGVGIAVALYQFYLAGGVVLIVLAINYVVVRIERRIVRAKSN